MLGVKQDRSYNAAEFLGVAESLQRKDDNGGNDVDEDEFVETTAELVETELPRSRPKAKLPMMKALPKFMRPFLEHVAALVGVSFLTIFMFTLWVDIEAGEAG